MTENTRIYYTGDQANNDGTGTITKIEQTKWGLNVTVMMDDGREIFFHSLPSDEFSGNCSTRFVTLEAYNTYRKNAYKKHYNLDVPDTKTINHNIKLAITIAKKTRVQRHYANQNF